MNFFFFSVYPYICISVCLIGCWARFDSNPYSWRSGSSEIFDKKILRWASPCFHIGVICLLLGHAVGLLMPPAIENFLGITPHFHQLLAAGAGAVFALICAIGGAGLIYRRIFNPQVRATSEPTDLIILLLIYAQLCLGIAGLPHSFAHPDGKVMGLLGEWCRGVLIFQPHLSALIAPVPWIYKCHVILGMTLILSVPFTRLVHIISAPIWYLLRPGYQIVRKNANLSSRNP